MNYDSLIPDDYKGVIAFSKNGKSEIKVAFGYADMANQRENNLKTKFATANAGKSFVACAIFKFVEDKKINLDTPIGSILEAVYLGKIDRTVTVGELLNHTTGIPDYFNSTVGDYDELFRNFPNYRIRKPNDLLPLFINKPMNYNGYGKFLYTNSNYILLALIIEALSRKPFDVYIKEQIFERCEMNDTGYYSLDRLPANTASNYIYDKKHNDYYLNIYSGEVKGTGAGGVFTTVEDMEKFWRGLADGKVFNFETTFKSMLQSDSTDGLFGYGFWLKNGNPVMQGSEPGISFVSLFDLEKNNIITLMSNFESNVWRVLDGIMSHVFY
ncbi:MAG: beta-lactamase family protein [Oscillospiraceae bacterium]|nr:beta-lactamase family protein [Oscillospiraceae bacterium]